jgi:hypothetical protein
MTIGIDSQNFESYLPTYDVIPDKWEEARPVLVEELKKHANAINSRLIGFYLDQELLSGGAFIPGVNIATDGGSSQQFRTILRKVIIIGPMTAGTFTFAHGILVDANFTLIELWASATNSTTLTSTIFGNSDTIRIIGPNVQITSDGTYNRVFAFVEYIQEL